MGIGNNPIPYIPDSEKDSQRPTVFWIKPKTVGLIQRSQHLDNLRNVPGVSAYITEEKIAEFLLICTRVDNVIFSDSDAVTEKVEDSKQLARLANELAPTIIEEVLDIANSWSMLKASDVQCLSLMTYFALVKNEDMSVQDRLSYDCANCEVMKKYEERVCFVKEDVNEIPMPVLTGEQDDFTAEYEVFDQVSRKRYTAEEFLTEFFEIARKLYPTVPSYLALQRLHSYLGWTREVCVTGLIADEFIKVLDWAVDCKNMSALPYPGDYMNQPHQLISAFKVVNTAISEYERVKLKVPSGKSKGKES